MSLKNWSTTAGSNATVDSINFAENQAPSTVNDSARALMADVRTWYEDLEWRDWGHTVTYASATSFTIATDLTAIYTANRPIRCTDSSTLYGRIVSSSYGAPNTTVNVILETGSLSVSLTAVSLGFKIRTMSVSNGVSSQSGTASYATNIAFTDATATRTVTVPNETGDILVTTGLSSLINNVGLVASVSAKAITIALKTKALADPSAGSPVSVAFRNATAGTGDYSIVQFTAAKNIVIPSGATLGVAGAGTAYIHVYLLLRSTGTTSIGIQNATGRASEWTPRSSLAIGTGSDSTGILYADSANSWSTRYIGLVEIVCGAVAGEWDNAPTTVYVGPDGYG